MQSVSNVMTPTLKALLGDMKYEVCKFIAEATELRNFSCLKTEDNGIAIGYIPGIFLFMLTYFHFNKWFLCYCN